MSRPTAPPAAHAAPSAVEWGKDRNRNLEALRRLDDVHTKVRSSFYYSLPPSAHGRLLQLIDLRSVIPSILHPLAAADRNHVSRIPPYFHSHLVSLVNIPPAADLYARFSARALTASEEIAAFTAGYVECRPIFDHAAIARAKNPTVGSVRANELFIPAVHEGVHQPRRDSVATIQLHGDAKMKDAEQVDENQHVDTPTAEVDKVLTQFLEENPDITVQQASLTREKRSFTVCFRIRRYSEKCQLTGYPRLVCLRRQHLISR